MSCDTDDVDDADGLPAPCFCCELPPAPADEDEDKGREGCLEGCVVEVVPAAADLGTEAKAVAEEVEEEEEEEEEGEARSVEDDMAFTCTCALVVVAASVPVLVPLDDEWAVAVAEMVVDCWDDETCRLAEDKEEEEEEEEEEESWCLDLAGEPGWCEEREEEACSLL